MKTRTSKLITALAVTLCCCGKPSSQEGKTVYEAYHAIKEGNWAEYSELLETFATLETRKQNISAIKESGSFLSTIKKEQKVVQKDQFDRVVGSGLLRGTEFVEISNDVRRQHMETLSGFDIPYDEYSIIVEKDGKRIDTREMGVVFAVIKYGTLTKIAGIGLTDPASTPE